MHLVVKPAARFERTRYRRACFLRESIERQILLGLIVLCVGLHGLSRVVLRRRGKIAASF
jgi:hypothetical protein